MKTAVCYYSRHHGNTLKVLQAMAAEGDVELIDVTARQAVRLDDYDCIGFASGIYGFEFQKSVVEFARQYLPQGKPVFFVYTYGGAKGTGAKAVKEIAAGKGCPVLGEFSCKGFDTFGPFKLVGGLAKGHPDDRDLKTPVSFTGICRKTLNKPPKAESFGIGNGKRRGKRRVYSLSAAFSVWLVCQRISFFMMPVPTALMPTWQAMLQGRWA